MEIIALLKDIKHLPRLSAVCDGVLFGSLFSLRSHCSLEELKEITAYCHDNELKAYLSIDALVSEKEKTILYEYFDYIKNLGVDGLYFTDLAVLNIAKGFGYQGQLIFEADTLITNSLDASFFTVRGIDVVLARELTLDEILTIAGKNAGHVDMQIFGHFRMSSSRRHFLSNYFKQAGLEGELLGDDLQIEEDTRSYRCPIYEDKFGTRIFTDYVFCAYKELLQLMPYIKRGIVDGSFMDDELYFSFLRDIHRLNEDNAETLQRNLQAKYPDYDLSTAYLYEKTIK